MEGAWRAERRGILTRNSRLQRRNQGANRSKAYDGQTEIAAWIDGTFDLTGLSTSAPTTNTMSTFTKNYGDQTSNTVLAKPNKWVNVTIAGNTYAIPCYQI